MQNDLLLDGKKYISVNRASKEIGYSQDYIGQLCRQNKIPARLIGRTWYVDISALSEYKNSAKSKSEKNQEHIENKGDLVSPSETYNKIDDNNLLRYESEPLDVLPILKNKKSTKTPFDLINNPIVFNASLLLSFFIVCNAAFSWLSFLAPRQAEGFNMKVASISNEIAEGFMSVKEDIGLALVASTTNNEPQTKVSEGIVVFPDSSESEELISKIKNSFSDEVEVLMDESGESGVIRPVFRTSDDSENYAFVLVPVESKI